MKHDVTDCPCNLLGVDLKPQKGPEDNKGARNAKAYPCFQLHLKVGSTVPEWAEWCAPGLTHAALLVAGAEDHPGESVLSKRSLGDAKVVVSNVKEQVVFELASAYFATRKPTFHIDKHGDVTMNLAVVGLPANLDGITLATMLSYIGDADLVLNATALQTELKLDGDADKPKRTKVRKAKQLDVEGVPAH